MKENALQNVLRRIVKSLKGFRIGIQFQLMTEFLDLLAYISSEFVTVN